MANHSSSAETPAIPFTRTLRIGSRGDDVRFLQQMLAKNPAIYPQGLVTGYFGSLTEAAVRRFQIANAIVTSGTAVTAGFGVVGPRTIAALLASLTASATRTASSSSLPLPSLSPLPTPAPSTLLFQPSPSPVSISPAVPQTAPVSRTVISPFAEGVRFKPDCSDAPPGIGAGYCWQTRAFMEIRPDFCSLIAATTIDLSPAFCLQTLSQAASAPLVLTLALSPVDYKPGQIVSGKLQIYNKNTSPVITAFDVRLSQGGMLQKQQTIPIAMEGLATSVFNISDLIGANILSIPGDDSSAGPWTLGFFQKGTTRNSSVESVFNVR